MKFSLSILLKIFTSSCILFFIFPSMIKSQDIYVSSKSIFTQTTHIINVDDEYKYNSGPGRGVNVVAKIKLGLGLETGLQVDNLTPKEIAYQQMFDNMIESDMPDTLASVLC